MANDCGDKGEYCDIYDGNHQLTGLTAKRGARLAEGQYRMAVGAWIINGEGKILIIRRAIEDSWNPGKWFVPGGGALAGEDGLAAAIREANEETGIVLSPENGELFFSETDEHKRVYFLNYLFRQAFDLADTSPQNGEVMDVKAASFQEICAMICRGEFLRFSHFDALEETLRKYGLKYEDCPEIRECNRLTDEFFENDKSAWFNGHLPLAQKGYALAECQVGWAYWEGVGVLRDLEMAEFWTERAARHGDLDAINNLPEIRKMQA